VTAQMSAEDETGWWQLKGHGGGSVRWAAEREGKRTGRGEQGGREGIVVGEDGDGGGDRLVAAERGGWKVTRWWVRGGRGPPGCIWLHDAPQGNTIRLPL
jgi:hypothetical protein